MPQLSKARELREQRGALATQALAVLDDKNLNREERNTKYAAIMTDVDRLKEQIDQYERIEAVESEIRTAPPAGQPSGNGGQETDEERKKKYHAAFRNYLKYGWAPKPQYGIRGVSAEERALLTPKRHMVAIDGQAIGETRDMGSGGEGAYPGATSGFFVPVGFVDKIEEALKYYGPMLQGGPGNPEIMDTATGQPLPFPTDNDTTITGELVGENQLTNSQDVSLSQILLGAYKYSSKIVKVSIELLQDSAFDMEAYLIKKFGIRIGRILNTHFTIGTGTTQPYGIVVQATLGATAAGAATNDGGAETGTTSIGSDDLVNLEHSVDILYRRGAKWMMHDSTLALLKKLKDKYGRPLWLPGLAANAPDTINGYGYLINNDMDTVGVHSPPITAKSVLFGAMEKYLIRRVKDVTVLRLEERYAEYGQVGFVAWARYDGNLLDAGTHPVRYLQQLSN
jgi:HK97 family phage major capsid protein